MQADYSETSKERCWFCEQSSADDASAATLEMHAGGFVGKSTQYYVSDTATLPVPRCARCKDVHDRVEGYVGKGGILGLLAGVVAATLVLYKSGLDSIADSWKMLIGVIVFFGLIGGTVSWVLVRILVPKDIKDQREREQHPLVKQKIQEGWIIGPKPPGL